MTETRLTLPYPPSVNHYYKRNRNGTLRIGEEGRVYRAVVAAIFKQSKQEILLGGLELFVCAYPPDLRVRDLGNIDKALEDAMTMAGVYVDDVQIRKLGYEFGPVSANPRVEIVLAPYCGWLGAAEPKPERKSRCVTRKKPIPTRRLQGIAHDDRPPFGFSLPH